MPRKDLEARRAYDRRRYSRSRKQILARRRARYQANREAVLAKSRIRYAQYYRRHRKHINAKKRTLAAVYYKKHRKEILAKRRAAYAVNPAPIIAKNLAWRSRNRKLCVEIAFRRHKERYSSDPAYRLRRCLRARVQKVLKGETRSAASLKLIGAPVSVVRDHLTALLQPGMTWRNYGKVWHIDHRRPIASFDLTKASQQRECFHYTNLQPLFVLDNLRKGARV